MKSLTLSFVLVLALTFQTAANPVDATPVARISELLFDDADNWTLELYFPFAEHNLAIDSLIIDISGRKAQITINCCQECWIGLVTIDSLSSPLSINRTGDQIEIFTYSTDYDYRDGVRVDKLIFGNRQFASVGAPVSNYSIIRNTWRDSHHNFITVDCLTQNPSLGYVNDTVGLTGKLVGKIFDSENNPVTALKVFPASPTYFRLHTPIEIYEDGVFSTPIFRKFQSETIRYLDVRMDDFAAWSDSIAIEPLELSNIKPDTVLTQDIHLRDDKYVLTNIEAHELAITNLRVLNYPNPFNTSTNFLIDLPDQLDRNEATIKIYNSRAQLVKDLKVGKTKTIRWNGIDNNGIPSPSGVYYYQLHLDGEMLDRGSLILLK